MYRPEDDLGSGVESKVRWWVGTACILANLYRTFCRTSYFLLQDNAVILRDMIIGLALVPRVPGYSQNAHALFRGRGPGTKLLKLQRCANGA